MRLRYLENGHQILKKHKRIITQPEKYKGDITKVFPDDNPVHLEIGTGKGKFLRENSILYPEINFFGIEMNTKVIGRSLEFFEEYTYGNLFILHTRAEMINEIFEESSIDMIYLNFSDPWPKEKHSKRRLSSEGFLEMYERILRKNGRIRVKTDNENLFVFSCETLRKRNWNIIGKSEDLYAEPQSRNTVQTEYEEKFIFEGKKIFFIEAEYI